MNAKFNGVQYETIYMGIPIDHHLQPRAFARHPAEQVDRRIFSDHGRDYR